MTDGARASDLLRQRPIWIVPLAIGTVLIAIMTVLYVGSTVDPVSHMHDLPVSVVNQDEGARVGGEEMNVGRAIEESLVNSPVVSNKLRVRLSSYVAAKGRMDRGGSFATVVIPRGLTKELFAIGANGPPTPATRAGLPQLRILSNVRAGTEGASLAGGVLQPALAQISRSVGGKLARLVAPHGVQSAATAAILANPLAVATAPYRPLAKKAALGLSAFYVALLVLMCGFIGAAIVNSVLDGALGFAATEIGPRWEQRRPVLISRWQTLLAKWGMALVLTAVLTAVMLLIASALLGLDAPEPLLLWLYGWFCAATVAVGTLALIAVLGTQGQLVALLIFVYLGLASAGGTVPIEALPGVLKVLSHADPLRQILGGVRSILYFDGRADAGLGQGAIATAVGLIFWLAFGALFVTRYDRSGLHRMDPELLEYVNRAADAYPRRTEAR
jgi:YhgE/Pip-like protein